MIDLNEPTAAECSTTAKVFEDNRTVGYALWYPQMGGYVGKAVALIAKEWREMPNGDREGGCIDVYVWHDGEFPFSGENGREPIKLHHCDPEQFIEFGHTLKALNEKQKRIVDTSSEI